MDDLDYYAYLAVTVPPGDLARSLTRKLARRAALALRRREGAQERRLLDAFCAADGRDLAFKLAAPRASQLWADSSRRDALRAAAERCPGLAERACARAERAFERRFEVFGRVAAFGCRDPVDWHCDPQSGGRFDPLLDASDPRLFRPGLDPKGPWAIARFEQALALGQGVWLGDELAQARYARELVAQVCDFSRQNPFGTGINWASPMEVALRATNLALAFLMMRHRPELQDPAFALCLATLLQAHGDFVEAHLEHTGVVPNNHYVANLVGLLHLGVVFPELPRARSWRGRAAAGLREQIRRQVLDDGFSFEGSTSYHRLATELFTLALFAADAGKLDLGEGYRQRLHRMYRAVLAYVTREGRAPQFGDNDSSRALPLADRDPLQHGYLLALGAALFGDADLRVQGAPYPDEAVFLMGLAGLKRFESLGENALWQSAALPKAGLYVLRSGDAYCAISCGPNGQGGIGGHGHNDKLGVEIHWRGRPVIVDTGTFCYSPRLDLRNLYRSTRAHSTVEVDGLEQSRIPASRPFALPDEARARMLRFGSTPARERFEGEHRGYERLAPPVRHRREVTYERAARAFVLVDSILGIKRRQVTARLHLPDVQARLRAVRGEELERLAKLADASALERARAVEVGPAGRPSALVVGSLGAELVLREFRYSPGYGQRQPSLCIELRVEGELPLRLATAVLLLSGAAASSEDAP